MKRYFLFSLLAAASAVAFTNTKQAPVPSEPPPEPWEMDLFWQDRQGWTGHLEFLYWKTVENGLSYALKMNHPAWDPTTSYPVGNYNNASYNIEPGFRISANYFRAPHFWEVWGSYTRLTARGKDTVHAPGAADLFLDSTWPTYLSTLTEAKSYIHLNYNVADVYVDRYFIPNYHLRLRLIGGLTGAWFDQNWAINYTDVDNNGSYVRNFWRFGGVGMRVGLNIDWYWSWDVYMTARGTIASIFGSYKNLAYQTSSAAGSDSSDTALPVRNATYRDLRSVNNFQFMIGPSWQKKWNGVRTELFAGYEMNAWTNVQEIYHSLGRNAENAAKEPWYNTGVLTLEGLTTRVTVEF